MVELQVAVAARNRSPDRQSAVAGSPDSRVNKLKEELENSRREIDFLNSVIVDMQKKLDDMKVKLDVSQATLLGQNVVGDHSQ